MRITEYDKQLIQDIREGRLETVDKMISNQDKGYRELAEKQMEQWNKLVGMRLPDAVLGAVSEYADTCSLQASRYSNLMYEWGLEDGLHLKEM